MSVELAVFAKLRDAFPAAVIGKLPRVTCKDCSDRSKTCTKHQKSKCNDCGNYISTAHIHLDYVGHAEVTDRLLTVDPAWTWEPVAFDDRGVPATGKGAGGETILWIKLTVCGVTRLGVGSVAPNAFDSEKQLIGDAIRNAAMRFGVALDLWAKEELESSLTGGPEIVGGGDAADPTSSAAPPASTVRRPPGAAAAEADTRKAGASGTTSSTGSSQDDQPARTVAIADAPATIPPAALSGLLDLAARKGLDDTALEQMAGKPLTELTEAESVALTNQVVKFKPEHAS